MAKVSKYCYLMNYGVIKDVVGGEKIYTPKDFKIKKDLVLFKDPNSKKFMVEHFNDFDKSGPNAKRSLGECYELDDIYKMLGTSNWLLLYDGK